jgi:hypothetical protein
MEKFFKSKIKHGKAVSKGHTFHTTTDSRDELRLAMGTVKHYDNM